MKSLSRVKKENPQAVTILLLQGVSVTQQAKRDLETNKKTVNHWFAVEDLLENEERRSQFFQLLGI
jgi:hypothetical protein